MGSSSDIYLEKREASNKANWVINTFQANNPFYTLWKHRITYGLLTVYGIYGDENIKIKKSKYCYYRNDGKFIIIGKLNINLLSLNQLKTMFDQLKAFTFDDVDILLQTWIFSNFVLIYSYTQKNSFRSKLNNSISGKLLK